MTDDIDIGQISKLLGQLSGNGSKSEYSGFEAAGGLRPKRKPIYKSPPVLTLKKVIGLSSGNTNYYATFKFYIQKPSLENPNTAVKLALQGAKGNSVFTMLSIDEIGELMSFFEKCYREGAVVVDGYKEMEEKFQNLRLEREKDEQNIFQQYAPEIAKALDNADIVEGD